MLFALEVEVTKMETVINDGLLYKDDGQYNFVKRLECLELFECLKTFRDFNFLDDDIGK